MSVISTTERGEMAAEELFHFGVKGMKWGVRKSDSGDSGGSGERGKIRRGLTKANTALSAGAKVIDDGEKKLIFLPQKNRNAAASKTQARLLGEAAAVNRDPQFKGKDLKKDPDLKAAYYKKVENAAREIYAQELGIARTEAWGEFLGVNTDMTTMRMRIDADRNRIQHAEDREVLLELTFDTDPLGHIVKVNVPEKYLKHGEDLELVHYGVKGMKWGVRTNPDGTTSVDQTRVRKSLRSTDKAVTVTQKKAGTYVKTSGGQRQSASVDAVRAQAGRQKARKSTTDALSNKELKDTIERMRLEQEFKKLDSKVSRKGRSFASLLMNSPAAQQVAKSLFEKDETES